ncbi:FUN14 family, putative [Angomonas deanei]|uniref:FUN14 family, putative n=1 Tax=Angomonas deanei TaxID=59799 RepID=A0A7G2CDQ2_9TRYP|nr:FUN14 family, putative [Angomonas deanei]
MAPSIPTPSKSSDNGKAGLYAKEFGVSGIMGAAVGVATRRLTSDALYGAGLCFVGLQTLAYLGFVSINWTAISGAISDLCDQNGDGKLDMEDVKIFFKKMMGYLSRGLPDAAGFTSGFFVGVKYLA